MHRPHLKRFLSIAAVALLHGLAFLALHPAESEPQLTTAEIPPLAISLITQVPVDGHQDQAPGSSPVTLANPSISPIAPPRLSLSPSDFTALTPYVRCALPEQLWREEKERCEKIKAALITVPTPPRLVEPNARMLAFAREAAERDAPKRLECIARRDTRTNWKCNTHSIWRDDAF